MDGTFLQRLKLAIHLLLPFSGGAVMVLAGLGAYLVTCLLTRHALSWGCALIPDLAVTVAIWRPSRSGPAPT